MGSPSLSANAKVAVGCRSGRGTGDIVCVTAGPGPLGVCGDGAEAAAAAADAATGAEGRVAGITEGDRCTSALCVPGDAWIGVTTWKRLKG